MSPRQFQIVLVTAPNRKAARQLARAALSARLAACANIIPGLESHYWWRGKIEFSPEFLILFKTAKKHLAALEKLIIDKHPYDTPEFVVLSLAGGNSRYLQWLADSVK